MTRFIFGSCCLFVLLQNTLIAEPWIDTRNNWLRADIETLSDAGIITVPITTYPLMWSGIIRDIDNTNIENVAARYKDVFWRVKKAGKVALSKTEVKQTRVSISSNAQEYRSFGDEARERNEISARRYNLNKTFAWNLEVTRVDEPLDGDKVRFDGSYLAFVKGNWVTSFGAIEKWWGPSWGSANLLSNNARPPVGLSLQRNYSNQSDSVFSNWLGPWTSNAFIARLDDERLIEGTKLAGVAFNFKPHQSLEIGVRATVFLDREGRTESRTDLVDNLVATGSCVSESVSEITSFECDETASSTGNSIAGFDIRWQLPTSYPLNLYASLYGEDETQLLPSKKMTQIGITSSFSLGYSSWKWFIESSDNKIAGELNRTYESNIYLAGYRHYQRPIGSNYDRDSKVISFGVLTSLNKQNRISFMFSDIELNNNSRGNVELEERSTFTPSSVFNRIKLNWLYQTKYYGDFSISINKSNRKIDEFNFLNRKYVLAIEWVYSLR